LNSANLIGFLFIEHTTNSGQRKRKNPQKKNRKQGSLFENELGNGKEPIVRITSKNRLLTFNLKVVCFATFI